MIAGVLTPGDFALVFTYFFQIAGYALALGALWIRVQGSAAGLGRVFELMDWPSEQDAPGARELPPVRRGVRVEDAHFHYPDGTPALRGVSFEARVGAVTALVGPVGSGKTTLVSLLPRFLSPSAGRIEIDGARHRARDARLAARAHRLRVPGDGALRRERRGQPAPRPSRRERRGDPPRRAQRGRRRLRARAARGLPDPARTRRRKALRRPEAAAGDRARAGARRRHPDPRRADLGARSGVRGAHHRRAPRSRAHAGRDRDRAPPLVDPRGGRDPVPRARPDRRTRHPRGADRAGRAAPTAASSSYRGSDPSERTARGFASPPASLAEPASLRQAGWRSACAACNSAIW